MAPTKKATTKTRKAGVKKAVSKKTAVKRAVKKTAVKKAAKKKTVAKTYTPPPKVKKVKPVKKDTLLKKAGPLTFPRAISLSLFAPMLPSNPDQIAIGVARLGGTFFILAGAFFALWNIQLFNTAIDAAYQTANTVQVTCDIADPACDVTATTNTPDLKPAVDFVVNESEPLTGKVDVILETGVVNSIKVKVEDIDTGEIYLLGNAANTSSASDSSRWKIVWDTERYPDGVFRLVAYVENVEKVVYVDESPTEYQVENHPAVTTTTTDTTLSTTTPDIVTSTPKPPTISSLVTDQENASNTVKDNLRLDIAADNALYVTIKLTDEKNDKVYRLGKAYQLATGGWRFKFDTTKYDNGTYTLAAVAVNDTADSDPFGREIKILNEAPEEQPVKEEVVVEEDPVVDDTAATEPPKIVIRSVSGGALSGYADLVIEAPGSSFVEIYARSTQSGAKKFLGLARKVDTDIWKFKWNTVNTPNGKYAVTAHVRNTYGYLESDPRTFEILNKALTTPMADQIEYANELEAIAESAPPIKIQAAAPEPEVTETDNTDTGSANEEPSQSQEFAAVPLVRKSAAELDPLLTKLAQALRAGDTQAAREIKIEINELKAELQRDGENVDRFESSINRVEESVAVVERILKERTGESLSTDSDGDGLTDYDEVNLYNTDPFAADSDGDGFNDGDEIRNGYDPKDGTPETLVAYESPKETGIVREDILKVHSITPATENADDADGVEGSAIITGTALPNSFVTLYIFSTPVIVTVRTESDGSWSYKFDKELEDGTHEVYVGVTDNAGKIVAKSEPLRFVKEAQAFTPVDVDSVGTPVESPQLAVFDSQRVILIILSISVVAIGLLLLLLGLHLSARPKNEFIVADETNPSVV